MKARSVFYAALAATIVLFAIGLVTTSDKIIGPLSGIALLVTAVAGICWAATSVRQRHGTVSPTSTRHTPSRAARRTGKPWNPPSPPGSTGGSELR